MKNMKRIITAILVICLISCKKERRIDNTGSNQKQSDTLVKYYKNGSIKEKGLMKNGLKVGWWTYYDSRGVLWQKDEYKTIYNKEFTNQTISYDGAGNIDYDKSWFFKI
ncbi:MAG: hypothetical protein HRT69_17685, partial [Flavobacteriaceae bacterium]|nr:hypothetical protein [Flavobacteriaceae bacterium]